MLATENRYENAAIWHLARRPAGFVGAQPRSVDYGPAFVPGLPRPRAARLAAVAVVLALTAASAALAAPGSSTSQGSNVSAQDLDTKTHQALLGLYALDSQVQAWHARVGSLGAAAAELRRQRSALRQQLGIARSSLTVAQRQLETNIRTLYEQGNVDPVAVMLGATSLSKGLRKLDDLRRISDESRKVVAATRAARSRLLRTRLQLAAEARRLARSLAAAQQAERRVESAAAARAAYVSSLRAKERLQASQVRSVVATAQAVQQKSQALQPTTTTAPPASGGRQIVVSATCYDLQGRTATGMPVGPGVVAVDPSVIPLGSRMYVPGYGNGVAADTGSGIQGATIDLWMTPSQCAAWGRRAVTITVY
jgi:3D (Asp-Asp-Asp) domain-containing protein